MAKITYLGPTGATFSEIAYIVMSELFGAPSLERGEVLLAENNREVLPLVCAHGGHGAIAMETDAEGRVEGSVNPFIHLLETFTDDCPITVLGAIKMPVSFVLMARPGIKKRDIQIVTAHPKALGACKQMLSFLETSIIESSSNGKAAEEVATNPKFVRVAALGPKIAAMKFGLNVLEEACEDSPAVTTFFLLGPKYCKVQEKGNRAVLVFRPKHSERSGVLVDILTPFKEAELSLRQVHSHYYKEGQYDFFIEIECGEHQRKKLLLAVEKAKQYMDRHILFGPFPVIAG